MPAAPSSTGRPPAPPTSVATQPGHTAFTKIRVSRSSPARVRVRAFRAAFVTWYAGGPPPIFASEPASDDTVDDPACSTPSQQREERFRRAPRPQQVRPDGLRDGAFNVGVFDLLPSVVMDAGIVDQHIEAVILARDLRRGLRDAVCICDVQHERLDVSHTAKRSRCCSCLVASRAVSSTTKLAAASCRQTSNPIPRLAPVTNATRTRACCIVLPLLLLTIPNHSAIRRLFQLFGIPSALHCEF